MSIVHRQLFIVHCQLFIVHTILFMFINCSSCSSIEQLFMSIVHVNRSLFIVHRSFGHSKYLLLNTMEIAHQDFYERFKVAQAKNRQNFSIESTSPSLPRSSNESLANESISTSSSDSFVTNQIFDIKQ